MRVSERQERTHRPRRSQGKTKPRHARDLQMPEEARKDCVLEASEGVWPCRLLEFWLLASRTGREKSLLC